ncbi:MAG: cytochrome c [Actinomycetota bacterium]
MRATIVVPLLSLLLTLGLVACGGGSDSASGSGGGADPAVVGAEIYERSCATCHGADGGGFVGPPVVGVHDRLDDAAILDVIANGRIGEVGQMPGWSGQYSPAELAAVAEHLRTLG